MNSYTYRVDSRMYVPVVLALISGMALVLMEGFSKQGALLLVVLLPFLYLGAEILSRKVILDNDGITIKKFLRSVQLDWRDIQMIDAIQSGSKIFLILQNVKTRPVLITNTIESFKEAAGKIISFLPASEVSDQTRIILDNPPAKFGPVVQAWIVFIILTGLLVGKFMGY